MSKNIISIFVITILLGCTSPKEHPVSENSLGGPFVQHGVGVLATTSERRVVVINKDNLKFCAEPPPDVAESIANSVRSSIEATVSASDINSNVLGANLSASGELARALSTNINQLFKPTQGTKILRDGWYNLCQAYVNDELSDGQYLTSYKYLLERLTPIITMEIKERYKNLDKEGKLLQHQIAIEQLKTEQSKLNLQIAIANAEAAKANAKKSEAQLEDKP